MSMFSVSEDMLPAFAKANPFMGADNPFLGKGNPLMALMPGVDEMQKQATAMMKDFALPGFPAIAEGTPFAGMVPDLGSMQQNMDEMMKSMPGMDGMANLAAHPVAAAAAGTAVSMGVASQMMGLVFGTVTSMVDGAVKAQKATSGSSVFAKPSFENVNPWTFEWAFGTADKATAPKKAGSKKARSVPQVAAIEDAARSVNDAMDKATDAMFAAADTMADAVTEAMTGMVETSSKIVSGAFEAVEAPAEKLASPAKAKAPEKVKAPAKPAAPVAAKVAAAPASATPAAEAVALAPQSGSGTIAVNPLDLMPEDFIQPKKVEKPATPDDLKMIAGVGPKLEQVLNNLGIWTFAQIATWSPNEVAWVDDYLQFKGRIMRDDWIAQADALAAGGRDEYVKRFGREPR